MQSVLIIQLSQLGKKSQWLMWLVHGKRRKKKSISKILLIFTELVTTQSSGKWPISCTAKNQVLTFVNRVWHFAMVSMGGLTKYSMTHDTRQCTVVYIQANTMA